MERSKTQITGPLESFGEPLNSPRRSNKPQLSQDNSRRSFRGLTYPIRISIGRLLLRLSALCAVSAVKVAPELVQH
jgi:hypothetical protein